jgi:NAD(P)-dependent dehydrogenase (short-subunit alcohol dehydrogenase family)
LVTGASGNLGRAVCDELAGQGTKLVLGYGNRPPAIASATAIQVDLSKPASIAALVGTTLEAHGRLDAVVDVVGGFALGTVTDTDDALLDRMLELNLRTAFRLVRAVLPGMLERKSGRIVLVGTLATLEPYAGAAAYQVSKAALAALVRTLGAELEGTGVTANAVLPATMDTPENRSAMPDADPTTWIPLEAAAKAIAFLASEGAGHIQGALLPLR